MPVRNPRRETKPASFSRRLLAWYEKNARDLPWRRTRNPYCIWVSEVMLQQTTVATVVAYYERWMRFFPTLKKAARAPIKKILSAWQGLGYYQRARNLHRAAKIICRTYGGRIPAAPDELKKLPGFGPYTTAAVLSIAFDQRLPVIDVNVRRVVRRLLALGGEAGASCDDAIFAFLEKAMPDEGTGIFNQAVMELGALVCRAPRPLCASCPVRTLCLAYGLGCQDVIPLARKKTVEKTESVAAIIEADGRYLIRERPQTGLWAGMWEFPGTEARHGEPAEDALRRHLKEGLGATLESARAAVTIKHAYTRFRNTLYAFYAVLKPRPRAPRSHKWVVLKALKDYPMPSVHAKIAHHLKALASAGNFDKL